MATDFNNHRGTGSVQDGGARVARVAMSGPDGQTGTVISEEYNRRPARSRGEDALSQAVRLIAAALRRGARLATVCCSPPGGVRGGFAVGRAAAAESGRSENSLDPERALFRLLARNCPRPRNRPSRPARPSLPRRGTQAAQAR